MCLPGWKKKRAACASRVATDGKENTWCADYSTTGGITMNYTVNTIGTLAILAAWFVSTAVITLIVAYFTGDLK